MDAQGLGSRILRVKTWRDASLEAVASPEVLRRTAPIFASIASNMAAVSIRDLDDDVRDRLRIRAARNGRSMEAEIRAILTAAVSEPDRSRGLFLELLDRFGEIGGVELDLPARANVARAPDLAQ